VNQIQSVANTFPLLSYYYDFGPLAALLCWFYGCCCCLCDQLIAVILIFFCCHCHRYSSLMLIPQHDAVGRWLIATILIFFAVTFTTRFAVSMLILWDVAIVTGLLLYFNIRLLSLSLYSFARWHRSLCFADADTATWCCWRPIDCYYLIFFADTLTLNCYANADTARWCCSLRRRLIVVILIFVRCRRRHRHLLGFTDANTATWCCWRPIDC